MKKYKILLFSFIFLLIIGLHTISNAEYNAVTKYESVLTKDEIPIVILPKDSFVKVEKKGAVYSRVTYKRYNKSNKTTYSFSGYILNTSLKKSAKSGVNYGEFTAIEETKKEIIKMANRIYDKNLTYSMSNRANLYHSSTFNEATSVDCSGLCSSIYKYSFNKIKQKYNTSKSFKFSFTSNLTRGTVGDRGYPLVVKDFYDIALTDKNITKVTLETGKEVANLFYAVDIAEGSKDKLNIANMQIGDSVVMQKNTGRNNIIHIYMYIGDGKLIESIDYDGNNYIHSVRKISVPNHFVETYASTEIKTGRWYKFILIRPYDKYMKQNISNSVVLKNYNKYKI